NEEVDRLRKAATEGKNWIAEMEARERERTGIKSLKIRYNENFGYYIEVTKANIGQVPEDYVRKQTLVNCERFTTEALAELEKTILGAEKKVVQLEYELFCQLRDAISSHVKRLKATAHCIAELDALCSLAEVADRNNYVKPQVYQGGVIEIQDGRHPVVEKMLSDNSFVPNDTWLDMEDNRIAIITGPNMAGKSTYMRQVALIVLMAQAGSFVPASYARIGLVDRIFTRVGASDDLASGQSTFMVEMSEVANILSNATPNSLLILDEIGRGTSTHDGLSIAWAVIEYINDRARLGSRTLFATHYHELTELEDKLHGIKNYCVSVRKKGDDIIFLRKISRGGADRSYGVEVAKLAGIPDPVIQRARVILEELDEADINKNPKRKKEKPVEGQLDLFASSSLTKAERDVLDEIRALDPSNLTPLDALNKLYSLQQKLK
ncbi:MAG TPA: DNA mismatch repair protein MutS, partial [Thermoclostridium caenicola]|uniref:DNA mismatch repair protein MutS n=1 Tax=Thermoclostridium caenicola TaxID=659425 RepID=UPI002B6FDEF7